MTDTSLQNDLEQVVAALAAADRVLIATHENPDGDAVGSMSAAASRAAQPRHAGAHLHPRRLDDPARGQLPRDQGARADASTRPRSRAGRCWLSTAATSAASARDTPRSWTAAELVVDVDHHHDNSRFGDVNLVDGGASSTAELLARDVRRAGCRAHAQDRRGAVRRSGDRHRALPVPHDQSRRVAAGGAPGGGRAPTCTRSSSWCSSAVPFGKLKLLGRVIDNAEMYEGGRLVISHVTRDDLAFGGGRRGHHRGSDRHLRAIEGVEVAAVIREQVPLADGTVTRQPRLAAIAGRHRRVGDRAQVPRRWPQAGRRVLARWHDRRDPRVHRGRGRRTSWPRPRPDA